MAGETLVLSAAWEPVSRVPWQRAVTLWAKGLVEVIEEYEDRELRSTSFSMKMPSIIRFFRGLRKRKRAIKFSRENVYARDKGRCQYCDIRVPRHDFTYDHVIPRSMGGQTKWDNVVVACTPCNQRKGGRTPAQAGMKLKTTPIRPKFLPDVASVTFLYDPSMPKSWLSYVRDIAYWHGELDQDQ